MIKRSTWILLILLILVIGAYFLIKKLPSASSTATPTALGNNFLITKADGTLQNLQIVDTQGHSVQILRNSSGTWMVAQPTVGIADQALASAADTQVGALLIITTLDPQPSLDTVQLSHPADTIELTFSTGIKHTIEIGSLTPTVSGYYVRLDSGNIYVVSRAGIDSLLNLLTAPPYPATETPTQAPTVEPTLTPTP